MSTRIKMQSHGNHHIIAKVTCLEEKQEVSPRGDVSSSCDQVQQAFISIVFTCCQVFIVSSSNRSFQGLLSQLVM